MPLTMVFNPPPDVRFHNKETRAAWRFFVEMAVNDIVSDDDSHEVDMRTVFDNASETATVYFGPAYAGARCPAFLLGLPGSWDRIGMDRPGFANNSPYTEYAFDFFKVDMSFQGQCPFPARSYEEALHMTSQDNEDLVDHVYDNANHGPGEDYEMLIPVPSPDVAFSAIAADEIDEETRARLGLPDYEDEVLNEDDDEFYSPAFNGPSDDEFESVESDEDDFEDEEDDLDAEFEAVERTAGRSSVEDGGVDLDELDRELQAMGTEDRGPTDFMAQEDRVNRNWMTTHDSDFQELENEFKKSAGMDMSENWPGGGRPGFASFNG